MPVMSSFLSSPFGYHPLFTANLTIVESYLLFCLVDFFEERLLTFDRQLLTFYPEVVQFIENHIPGVGKGLLGKYIFAIAVGAFVGHPSDEAFC